MTEKSGVRTRERETGTTLRAKTGLLEENWEGTVDKEMQTVWDWQKGVQVGTVSIDQQALHPFAQWGVGGLATREGWGYAAVA